MQSAPDRLHSHVVEVADLPFNNEDLNDTQLPGDLSRYQKTLPN
jgi:hypothetical protein